MPASLKLNGKPFELTPISPSIHKVKAFLDKSPADELLTTSELSLRIHLHTTTISQEKIFGHSLLQGCSARIGQVRYWGNPKAIAELLRQVGA